MSLREYKITVILGSKEIFNIGYYYNSTTTIQDLKEYISGLLNYSFCPCILIIYTNSFWNEISKYNNSPKTFLYKSDLNNYIKIVIETKLKCKCSDFYKERLKLSKMEIIKKEYYEIIELRKQIDNLEQYSQKLKEENQYSQKLQKDYEEKLKEINNQNEILEKKIKQKEEKEKQLNETINELNNEKSLLTVAINKDIGTLKQFQELGLLKNINPKGNEIKIDPNTRQILPNSFLNEEVDFKTFYDIIINIKSIKDISDGWEIKMTKNGEDNYIKYRDQELIRIGVIGNSNKGKSFILSKISKITLPSGTSIKTEGLSIKYPELKQFKNRKIVLLDSAGLETPVLKGGCLSGNENKNSYVKEKKEKNGNQNVEKKNGGDKNEKKKKNFELFKEKSREKIITELFLQNYIINNSDILILVVGILSYSEQKLLNRIKNDIQKSKINKPLFIIHNLKTYYTKQQVEKYINNYLLKSATFELKKGHKTSTDLKNKDGDYYFETNSEPHIFHLLFANEGSEAGNYYNDYTLYFIEHAYQQVTDLKPFNVIKTIKERFIDLSKEIIEKTDNKLLSKEDIISDEEIIKTRKIKLVNHREIVLKRCLIDELGFSNLKGNGFEPNYNYFIKGNKIEIRVEVPGNSSISSKIEYSGEYTVIRLKGVKIPDIEPKIEDNLYNTREFGEFNLNIFLKSEDYNIKNEKPKKNDKKGVIILEYEYEPKSETYDFNDNNDDKL